jgi:hypothetical protein
MEGGISALAVFIGFQERVGVTGPTGHSQELPVIQEMAMSTQATHYESAVRAMSQAAAEAELTHAPIRLAYWRIAALDTLLDRLEELRLSGERALPEDIRDLVVAYAARHDAELADRVQRIDPDDLNGVHDAVFEAQGRVMLELAQLRRVPNWQDLDLTLAPGDDEAA